MARKRLIAGIVATLLAPSIGWAQTCPGGMNKAEIGARYLVTEFMVAALSCRNDPGFRDSYASFVRRYNAGLVGNAQAMKSYFGGGASLDSYVTRLANHAALRQNEGTYCSHARQRIDRALSASKTASLAQVIDGLGYAQGGPACGDMTPVAALAGKGQIGTDKATPVKATPASATPASATPASATPASPPARAATASPPAAAAETPQAAPPMPDAGGASDLSPSP